MPHVELFADGNLKDVLGSKDTKASPSGAIGLHYRGNRYEAAGLVNVAGSSDTVRTAYGATLLMPATGSGLNAGALVVRGRFKDWNDPDCAQYGQGLACNIGLRLEANASSRTWATKFSQTNPAADPKDTVPSVLQVAQVPMWGVDADLSYSFFEGAIESSDTTSRRVAMLLDVGVAARAIRGDLASDANSAVRQSLLGENRTTFAGLHIGLTLLHNDVRSAFTYYRLNGHINGMSGGQIVATVELRTPLASGFLKRN